MGKDKDAAKAPEEELLSPEEEEKLLRTLEELEAEVALKTREAEESTSKIAMLSDQISSLQEESSKKETDLAETVLKVGALTATVEALTKERDEARSAPAEVPVSSDADKGESEIVVAKLQARVDELESELQFLRLA